MVRGFIARTVLALWGLAAIPAQAEPPDPEWVAPLQERWRPRWVGFSPTGKYIATREQLDDRTGRVCVWRAEGKRLHEWPCPKSFLLPGVTPTGVFDSDEKRLLFAGQGQLVAGDLASGRAARVEPTFSNWRGAAFDHLGRSEDPAVIVGLGASDDAVAVERCPLAGGREPVADLRLRRAQVKYAALSPDSKYLVVASAGDRGGHVLEVLAAKSGAEVARVSDLPAGVSAVAVARDGRSLVFGREDGALGLVDLERKAYLGEMSVADRSVATVAFHPTEPGRVVFATRDRGAEPNVGVFDTRTRRVVGAFSADPNGVGVLAVSPDGKWLATMGGSPQLKLWSFARAFQK